ncbi:YphA family membrane protein [Virgibacillus ndiopensis]|uniref:YphA family membrane protein n=1 Tax=Virgibacillus ndiopensis TaxID=2004408 RepID=UPI000C0788CB|nr:hypothetical protein [Virgibacillus ndiopensis]
MTSGIIFYWIGWIFWVIVTFFMKKGRQRTFYACWILLIILCSPISIPIGGYQIGVSFLILLAGSTYFHSIAKSLYLLFSAFTISLGYIAILFWERITPVWLFLPRSVLIPLIMTFLIVILTESLHDKLAIGLLGITSGEILHSIILSSYQLYETIGGLAFLDIFFMITMLVIFIETVQKVKVKLYAAIHEYKQSLRWKMNQH